MAFFIQATIKNELVTFELDATTNVDWTFSGDLTSNPVSDGKDVTDNYVDNKDVVSMSGLITDVTISKRSNKTMSPQDYIEGLQTLKNTRETFTVTFSENLNVVANCLFKSVSVSKTQTLGSDAWNIQFVAEQIRFVPQAEIVKQPASSLQDQVTDKTTGPGGTQEPIENKNQTLLEKLIELKGGASTIDAITNII